MVTLNDLRRNSVLSTAYSVIALLEQLLPHCVHRLRCQLEGYFMTQMVSPHDIDDSRTRMKLFRAYSRESER